MSNSIGTIFRFTIWGQSHSEMIGVTVEGLPAGSKVNIKKLQSFLDRRRPGKGRLSTKRNEADSVEFLSGLLKGRGCGCPITAVIKNTDVRSGDYDELKSIPRPGHADYPAMVRFGEYRDHAGGGQFSGRLTAPLCIAGGIALQQLETMGIKITAKTIMIAGETDPKKMKKAVEDAATSGDSVGGIVECVITGLPVGIGEPMFDGLENRIAQLVFGIPAVKGIEFGNGFSCASVPGSKNNDAFYYDENGEVKTATNNHGGILGGMSSGMPVVFRAAIKPTPSIAMEQRSVDMNKKKDTSLTVRGRHDPVIALRAVPVLEAAAAAAVYDLILIGMTQS